MTDLVTPITRFCCVAFRFAPVVVRAFVPPDHIGTYLLMRGEEAIYVGRSDHCVRRRLLGHPLMEDATHFLWQPARSAFSAFSLESHWFHRLVNSAGHYMNDIHPARPLQATRSCPWCNPAEPVALRRAVTATLHLDGPAAHLAT
jgi:hypothetical protein